MAARTGATRKTPLIRAHERLGAKLTDFSGWVLPLRYPAGSVAEHLSTRRAVGVFDVSHLGRVVVEGKGALSLLQRAFSNDLFRISPGRAQYTLLLDEQGGIVDDIVVLWEAPEKFLVVPNAANTKAVTQALASFARMLSEDVSITDITRDTAMVAVQGPRFEEVCRAVGMDDLPSRFGVLRRDDQVISGTGYTGERGIEVVVPTKGADRLFEELVREAERVEGSPAGLGARDTLRLEMGYPLWGNEMDRSICPAEAGLDWAVAHTKDSFVGKDAAAERGAKARWQSVGVLMLEKGAIPRAGYPVRVRGFEGQVTSGGFSPVLGVGIALARMPARLSLPELGFGAQQLLAIYSDSDSSIPTDELGVSETLPETSKVVVDIRGRKAAGAVCEPPFVKTSLS